MDCARSQERAYRREVKPATRFLFMRHYGIRSSCPSLELPPLARMCAASILPAPAEPFERGCRLGFRVSCENLKTMKTGGEFAVSPPSIEDYPVILRGAREQSATAT
jgi:hypothetical protein